MFCIILGLSVCFSLTPADVVEKVFDKSIIYPKGMDIKDPELQIEFDFTFLDDTYACRKWEAPKAPLLRQVSMGPKVTSLCNSLTANLGN